MTTESGRARASANQRPVSLWAAALNQLKEWDPAWAEHTVSSLSTPLTYTFMALASGATSRTRSRPVQRWKKSWKFLKLGVAQGVQACNLGFALLTGELERDAAA
jgi:hypothetical protein